MLQCPNLEFGSSQPSWFIVILRVTNCGSMTEHTYYCISPQDRDHSRSFTFKFFLSSRIDKSNFRCDCLDQLQWCIETTILGFHFWFLQGGNWSMRRFSVRKMFILQNFYKETCNMDSSKNKSDIAEERGWGLAYKWEGYNILSSILYP